MAIREGRWRCKSCETENLGRNKQCTNCGGVRGDDVEFYLPEDAIEVTDEGQLDQAHAGPDWHCEHCGSDNRGDYATCIRCGAQKGESDSRTERFYPVGHEPTTAEDSERIIEADRQAQEVEAERIAGESIPGKKETGYYQSPAEQSLWRVVYLLRQAVSNPITIGLAAVAVLGLVVWFIFSTHPVTMTVRGHSWQRTVAIEHNVVVTEEGWTLPSEGTEISRERRIHHYNKVVDHYETRTRTVQVQTGTRTERYKSGTRSKGNGYFEDVYSTRSIPVYGTKKEPYQETIYRNDPVYQTWYTYRIPRWKHARTEEASADDQSPYWPTFTLASKEREENRNETYSLILFDDKAKEYSYCPDLMTWQSCSKGSRVIGHINRVGIVMRIKPAE